MPIGANKKIFFIVLLVHLALLGFIIFFSLLSGEDEYVSPVTAIEVVDSVELSPVEPEAEPEEVPEPVEEEIIDEEVAAEEPEKTEKAVPPPRKKVTRKIRKFQPETSDLKKRLRQRLEEIKSSTRPAQKTAVQASADTNFPFSWYENFIHSKIYSLWQRPTRSTVGKDVATALVEFRVYRDGHIEKVVLKESSESPIMDKSVLRAVRLADPFPPLPEGFRGDHVNFAILFELEK